MEQASIRSNLMWTAAALAVALAIAGCRRSETGSAEGQLPQKQQPGGVSAAKVEPEPAESPQPEPASPSTPPVQPTAEPPAPTEPEPEQPAQPSPPPEPEAEAEEEPQADAWRDLGPPLVEDPEDLQRLDPVKPIWLDQKRGDVVMVGQVCQQDAPLELFACLRDTKEHEAIVTVDIEAYKAHAGLMAVGADPGSPVKWEPEYVPASGTEIEVTVIWKDEQGRRHSAKAQDWVLDVQTKKAMTYPWVFAGSWFWKDDQTGKEYYQAEGGDLICVSNFASAMLDLPIKSSQDNSELLFRAFTERIPPLATPVTIVLKPKLEKKTPDEAEAKQEEKQPQPPAEVPLAPPPGS